MGDDKPAKAVREWDGVDAEVFAEVQAAAEPAVMRGLCAGWPLVDRANRSPHAFADYVRDFDENKAVNAFFGDKNLDGRFFYSDDLKGFNFDRRDLTLGELLDTLFDLAEDPEPGSVYAGAIPLTDTLAPLLAENPNPLLDPSVEQLNSIWIGNRCRTALHWDLSQNIAVVAQGRRTFTLIPPEQLPNLYIGPLDFTLAGQPVSLVDLADPDFERFPKFRDALATVQTVTLEPGDALYLPAMWYHGVESHDTLSVLVNFWWRDSELYMFSPMYTMLHGLLSIRDMPQREREIWRLMFDYYLFQTDGEPMEHIPEDARGVFRDMHPELIVSLRAFLLKSLGGVPRR